MCACMPLAGCKSIDLYTCSVIVAYTYVDHEHGSVNVMYTVIIIAIQGSQCITCMYDSKQDFQLYMYSILYLDPNAECTKVRICNTPLYHSSLAMRQFVTNISSYVINNIIIIILPLGA